MTVEDTLNYKLACGLFRILMWYSQTYVDKSMVGKFSKIWAHFQVAIYKTSYAFHIAYYAFE